MPQIGETVGNYRLVELLGIGAFSSVYRAEHTMRKRHPVAIKFLSQIDTDNSSQERDTFFKEAQILNELRHRSILPILNTGLYNKIPYIITPYAPNGTLRDYLKHQQGQPVTLEEALRIIIPIGEALHYIHKRTIVHGDLKPENILFNAQNEPLLADFGKATILNLLGIKQLHVLGTPSYMTPEQFSGIVNSKDDQYALGCILYELLTGRKPLTSTEQDMESMWYQHAHVSPAPPKQLNPTLPDYAEAALLKAIAKRPNDRHKDVEALLIALGAPPRALHISSPTPPHLSIRGCSFWVWFLVTIGLLIIALYRIIHDLIFPPANIPTLPRPISIDNLLITLITFSNFSIIIIIILEKSLHLLNPIKYVEALRKSKYRVLSTEHQETNKEPTAENPEEPLKDFFISYAGANWRWAKWIKWHLDEAGYSTVLLTNKVQSDASFETEIQNATNRAKHIIIVLSLNYFEAFSTSTTRIIDTLKQANAEETGHYLPVCIQECVQEFKELLESIKYIDLSIESDEVIVRAMLLAGIRSEGIELTIKPMFPGINGDKAPTFPGKELSSRSLLQETQVDLGEQTQNTLSSPMDNAQQPVDLKESDTILTSLNRLSEELRFTQELIRSAPSNTIWLEGQQQQSKFQLQSTQKGLSQEEPKSELPSIPLNSSSKGLKVFFSYSRTDERMRRSLEEFLVNLKRQYSISDWHDGKIDAGEEWAQEIDKQLSQADIILLLVSQKFIASEYCHEKEIKRALERHKKGEARVVPIILSPCDWKNTHFRNLEVLPSGGRPIITWKHRQSAYLDVVEGLKKVIDKLTGNGSPA
jgi:serine/threonine protein kinase